MRRAKVIMHGQPVAVFTAFDDERGYELAYLDGYEGPPISLRLPLARRTYTFTAFPAFFDGLLPEGPQLEALLRRAKLDRLDYFAQLVTVGGDLVGAVSVERLP